MWSTDLNSRCQCNLKERNGIGTNGYSFVGVGMKHDLYSQHSQNLPKWNKVFLNHERGITIKPLEEI